MYTLFKGANFGPLHSNLATIGYQLVNADGTLNGARITAGITERPAGSGVYAATVTLPSDFTGELRWDSGTTPNYYVSEAINDAALSTAILDTADAVEAGLTLRGSLRLMSAALVGILSGAHTGTVTIRNAVANSKTRITAVTDTRGNRVTVVADPN